MQKTKGDTGTARASNLSGHAMGDLMLVPCKLKSGPLTKGASEAWFQTRFGATWRVEFASFWLSNKPRDVKLLISDSVADALGLVSNELTVEPNVATDNKKPKRISPKELRALVWKSTMGDVDAGVCILCEATPISFSKPKGFELAHIRSDLDGGEAIPTNMVATCSACNGHMAGKDMQTWVLEHIKTSERRTSVNELIARVQCGNSTAVQQHLATGEPSVPGRP
jgi:hypothetical protein